MKNILWCVAVVLSLAIGYNWGRNWSSGNEYTCIDTIYHIDTIRDTIPIPKDSTIIRWKSILVPITDTVTQIIHDSVFVQIPIVQKEYEDSTYHAWVSGFEPKLDSIYVFPRTTLITTTITKHEKKPWGVGVQVGIGNNTGKWTPYIGIGVSYNIWNF